MNEFELSFSEIRAMVEEQSDNEFEDFSTFIRQWNNVTLSILQSTGLKFQLLNPRTSTTYENTTKSFENFTDFPQAQISVMISGLTWKILEIEQEENIFYWEQKFNKNCANLMIFMANQEDADKFKVQETNWTTIEQDWEE